MKFHLGFYRLFLLFLLFFSCFLYGCSDSVPEIMEIKATFVMDFKANGSLPQSRLSVFVRPTSDIGRVEKLKVTHMDTGLYWAIDTPIVLSGNKEYMAGSPFLMPPYYDAIPTGAYELLYMDKAGRSASAVFDVWYRDDLLKATVDSFSSKVGKEKIVVYSEPDGCGKLLYYGDAKNDWSNRSNIISSHKDAASIRICYELDQGAAICLMPPENL